MKQSMNKATPPAIALIVLLLLVGSAGMLQASGLPRTSGAAGPGADAKIDAQLQAEMAALAPGEMTTAIVTLKEQADLSQIPGANRAARQQGIIRALQAHTNASQKQIQGFLKARAAQGLVSQTTSFWVLNGLSVTAMPEVFQELAARDDVATITPDAIQVTPQVAAPEPNLSVIHAPALWDLGWRGQGVVVANMDSGVDVSHPDLATRWRGGSNSWYDPYGQHPTTPTDLSGHGTWTMGVMVGGDAGGTAIGVAPAAQWIAVKIFNDAGSSTATAIHLGFQWLLDPDGNPNTADAPDVVDNSWTFGNPGCNLEFQTDLRSLRATGIVPVFAAGNFGPGNATSASPANYPEALAVGATDNNDLIYAYSSRGPSACGEMSTFYPELVAPGVAINTTDLYGLYNAYTGTSLSAPHAAGGLALLLNAFPNLTADQQVTALVGTATDLGSAGPDSTFGYGRLDLLAAYNWLAGGGVSATPSPTPTATQTPTATPTATSTAMPTATLTPTSTATPTAMPTPTVTPTSTARPTATATRTPTSTPASGPTPTPLPGLHIGDLDGSKSSTKTGWKARVTLEAHNTSHGVLKGVTVKGNWSGGYSGTSSCITDATGRCQVSSGGISAKLASVTFSVTGATRSGYVYQPGSNHDPDGDSNGTAITVSWP